MESRTGQGDSECRQGWRLDEPGVEILMTKERSPLTPAQMEQVREELVRAKEKLERSLNSTRSAARPVALDQTAVGRLSRVDALQNQGLTKELKEREQARYAQIQEALRRIGEGTHGLCTGCGRPIRFERLMVFPETLACADCTVAP